MSYAIIVRDESEIFTPHVFLKVYPKSHNEAASKFLKLDINKNNS